MLKDRTSYFIVERFLSALLATAGYGPITITKLLDGESNRESRDLKRSIADVIVEDKDRRKFIIEIDRARTVNFLHKAWFNVSRLIVDSLSSGDNYSDIQKIFHVSILHSPTPDIECVLTHGRTIFSDMIFGQSRTRLIGDRDISPEFFIIAVPKFDDKISNEFHEWLYIMKHSAISDDFRSPYMQKVAERLNVLSLSPADLRRYNDYRKQMLKERDYYETGENDRSIEVAKLMLMDKEPLEKIIKYTGLSKERLEKL